MIGNDIAVKVQDLTKSFKIPLEASSGIKQKLINTLKGRRGYRVFTPLKDISFEVKKGDFFGIVGRNGSGKSTLLKTIAGIYAPNEGAIHVDGTLVPFIELGVGFNPELTGRENVFLNGALLGFSHPEIEDMYEEIVEFAELQDFMDERLKNYSSGMQVRLAFSIAIKAEGDILLLDEVLAVGDEAFQRKCYDYFEQLKRHKHTVILVTHDMAAVERFCNRAIFIEDGELKIDGKPHEVAAAYSISNDLSYHKAQIEQAPTENEETVKNRSNITIELLSAEGKKTTQFTAGEVMKVKLSWDYENVLNAGVAIFRQDGQYIFGPNTFQDGYKLKNQKTIEYEVKLDLAQGKYFLQAGLFGENDKQQVDFETNGPTFTVNRNKKDSRWGGVVKLKHEWK